MRINFNSVDLGLSGGNRVLFELSNALVDLGHDVSINFVGKELSTWFSPVKAEILHSDINTFQKALNKVGVVKLDVLVEKQKLLVKNMPMCDVNVAGYWPTAYSVLKSDKGRGIYLVQHYEPSFYIPNSFWFNRAEESYKYPLTKVCVSQWLAEKVAGVNIGNGINQKKFCRKPDVSQVERSVMFSLRTQKWKNSLKLQQLYLLLQDAGVKVFSTNEETSDEDLVKMYNQAEVYVNLSDKEGFGLGMLEAMACGCAVVSTPCSEYLREGFNCILVDSIEASYVADVVLSLLENKVVLERLVYGGYQTASNYSFDKVVQKFLKVIGD